MLRRREEIIEHVLFVGQRALCMPVFAEFAAAAQIGIDENAAAIEPKPNIGAKKPGRFAQAKASVAVQQHRIHAVELCAFAANDIDGYGCPVLGLHELANHFGVGE